MHSEYLSKSACPINLVKFKMYTGLSNTNKLINQHLFRSTNQKNGRASGSGPKHAFEWQVCGFTCVPVWEDTTALLHYAQQHLSGGEKDRGIRGGERETWK